MPVAPPNPRLPPLSHLAAFEAAARLGGYAAAGAAAGVTPGAIRAKTKALEAALGVTLFAPLPQGVALTPAGERLLASLSPALAALSLGLAPLGSNPPLQALIGFEAALRLSGFAQAAEAVGVSPGAIAAQVRRVEGWAGRPLFLRSAHGVAPTPQALAVQPDLARALQGLAQAVAETDRAPVRIATLPAVAQLWLAPRLPALRAALPGVTVSITALERLPDSKHAPYDLALFFARIGGVLLAEDALVPVCAPHMAEGLTEVADLTDLPRLTDSVWRGDWRLWQQRAAPGLAGLARSTEHSLYALAVAEAVAGAGVLIGHTALVQPYLDAGTLVAPFDWRVPCDKGLRLVQLRHAEKGRAACRVAAWLQRG